MAKRIVIMAGGTGGHVFPALAVAEEMRERGWDVSWLGTQRGIERRVVPEKQFDIDWLSVAGLRGKGLAGKVSGVFNLVKACWQSLRVLMKRKPHVVLGMGGFVAGPGGLMSWLTATPLIIHEQNRVPGTTNRLLSKKAKKVLEAFPASFDAGCSAIATGNPLRKTFQQIPEKKAWDNSLGRALNVLIVGGSQGAQRLNEVIPEALSDMHNITLKHQTGTAMQVQVQQIYDDNSCQAEAVAFIEDMSAAYQWADMVICRAGAMTVSEVAAAGLPAVFIPLPNAIDDHQMANAHFLADAGAAIILPQIELNKSGLQQAINTVMQNIREMGEKAKTMARINATQQVADICEQEAKA